MLAAMEEVVLSEETIPMMPLVKAGNNAFCTCHQHFGMV